jgi:membrane protease YdiL (CAAX protease family)
VEFDEQYKAIGSDRPAAIDLWGKPFVACAGTYILLIFLLIILPGLELALLFVEKDYLAEGLASPVSSLYVPTMIMQWLIVLVVAAVVYCERSSPASLGIRRPQISDLLRGVAFFILSAVVLVSIQQILLLCGLVETKTVDKLVEIAGKSVWWWLAVSVTVSLCEEIIYRGYLITRIRGLFPRGGWVVPILLTAFSFAAGHTYQGAFGFVLIFCYGILFGACFVYKKSLWPCIVAHFLTDFPAIFVAKW